MTHLIYLDCQMQYVCRQCKVHKQGDGVDDGCDQRACHNSRIKADPVCDHRQHTANRFGKGDNNDEGNADHQCDHHGKPVDDLKFDEVGCGKREAAHNSDADFFPDDDKQIFELDFIQRKSADDGDAGL